MSERWTIAEGLGSGPWAREGLTALKCTWCCVEHLGEQQEEVGFATLHVLAHRQRHSCSSAPANGQWTAGY